MRSCSLVCVQKHKAEADCDGVRERLKYLPLNNFSDMDVVSDFRLLEQVTQQVDRWGVCCYIEILIMRPQV